MLGDVLGSLGSRPGTDTCSRAGCAAPARHRVIWRNPRIHAPDRQKVWLACDEHVAYLRDFLAAREFPVRVEHHQAADDTSQTPHVSESD